MKKTTTKETKMKEATPRDREMRSITDTIPAEIFEGVTRYYERQGFTLHSYMLVTSGTYEATFTK